jgi:hypothetical protein
MDDDWEAFKPEAAPADPWAAFSPQAAPQEPTTVPPSFLHRLALGMAVGESGQSPAELRAKGFEDFDIGTNTIDQFKAGIARIKKGYSESHDPDQPWYGALQPGYDIGAGAFQALASPLTAAFQLAGGAGEKLSGGILTNEQIQTALMVADGAPGKFSRVRNGAEQVIGGLPSAKDFEVAAEFFGGKPEQVAALRQMWEEQGIHPAEAVHDAQNDAFTQHEISEGPTPFTEPPLVSPGVQPLSPPGRLSALMQGISNRVLDIGNNIQMMLSPMATGTQESMSLAKDFASTMRRNRWDWARTDKDLEARFTPEQRKQMWEAADEESVARQVGREPVNGLASLPPEMRAAIEELQTRSQLAWLQARNLDMVDGEGLPSYTPRMMVNTASASSGERALPLNGIGRNLRTTTAQMLSRDYLTAAETEAAGKAAYGEGASLAIDIRVLPLATARMEDAIAGRTLINHIEDIGNRTGEATISHGGVPEGSEHSWFTLDHPAFKKWRPKFETDDAGTTSAVKTKDNQIVFEQSPIYVRGDFEGPLRAVLDQKSGALYSALMALKGKATSLIMNSPVIHNAVEWGRALPAMPGKVVTFRVYFDGNAFKNNVPMMQEAIENGLVPIGSRFFKQDISSIMESPNLTPGRSWTSQVLGAIPGLFDEAAGNAVKRAIDKAGNFWHNTLLWDRVGDLQAGLYVNFQRDLLAKGVDYKTASRAAAHWANRFAGSLPKEAMSNEAQKLANLVLFSRSFTVGNLGIMKDALTGLPRDVMAQIERDTGALDPKAAGFAKSMARRKAAAVVALDIGLMYAGNSILQSAMNVMRGDHTLDEEMHGYAERFGAALQDRNEHPLKLLQPFDFLNRVSSTSENEPGKQNRVRIGYAKDGTAIYASNPVGRIGGEFTDWLSGPLDMMRRKMGTLSRPAWQVLANDKGFGRKIYDPEANDIGSYLNNMAEIAKHFMAAQGPEGQIKAGVDLVHGDGDKKVNTMKLLGPLVGTNVSSGAPGGPAAGELYDSRTRHQYEIDAQLPDIRKQILRGDIEGARDRMAAIGIPGGLARFYLKTTLDPATRLSGRTLKDFYRYATPEQKLRLENAPREAPQP